ncbi:hypothetical protein BH09SUM1_BH09SUM1_24470 [soil metagenome]
MLQSAQEQTVVVVSHGSRNATWVSAQREWFAGVTRLLPSNLHAELTFLEISDPLFEARLKELDHNQRVLILPFFLSHGGHAGEDIPELAQRHLLNFQLIKAHGLEHALGLNAARRLREMGASAGEAVIVSAYGGSRSQNQWLDLVAGIQTKSGEFSAAPPWLFAPAGHYLEDSAAPLREQLATVRAKGLRRCAILPLYLAVSSYQETLIPSVIAEFPDLQIKFLPSGVLPDPGLEKWAAELIMEHSQAEKNV